MVDQTIQKSDIEVMTIGNSCVDIEGQERLRMPCVSGQVRHHVYVHRSLLPLMVRRLNLEMVRPKIGDWRYQWAKQLLDKDPYNQLPRGFARFGLSEHNMMDSSSMPNKGDSSDETNED